MTDNLKLWHQVEKTPTEQTKAITGKAYNGTSPKPHWIVMKATETFGPCGIGWGFTVEERLEDGAMIEPGFFEKMHIAKVRVWYKWNGERGEVEHIGGTPFSGRRNNGKPFTDEDSAKKSVTDALVKALSMIGFAGDIFMGRYDDSKYVSELKNEEREAKRDAADPVPITSGKPKEFEPAVSTAAVGLVRELKGCKTVPDFDAMKRQPEFIQAYRAMNDTDKAHVNGEAAKHRDAIAANDLKMAG